jgi:predicted Rossmann fold nucleotide-binding protein DprA/Smf involved in DNA uptake
MPSQSRIKFNPATREFEIEGTEAFVKKYFDMIQELFGSESEKVKKGKSGTPLKTVKAGKKIVKGLLPSQKRAKPGTIKGTILKALENAKGVVAVKDIIKKTGLNKTQVNGTLIVLKKKGQVKSVGRGMYEL